jgi:diguanylate cyclase (GGDEF)-like protein/PAS domain S-box-containing protein
MQQQIRLLQELVSDSQYGVDETTIAETILARATTRRLVPDVAFRNDLRAAQVGEPADTWFDMYNDLACEADLDGYLTRLNPSWEACLGFTVSELMARPYVEFVHPDDVQPTLAAATSLATKPTDLVNFENRFAVKDGGWRWLLWSARSDGRTIYAMGKDVSERKQLEVERESLLARVEAMARTDELTGLANRRALDEEIRREIARAGRMGHRVTLAMLDIDRFKDYNDRHGHPAGDFLLREAAAAWRLQIRQSDFIGRYGGEEFVVILPDCQPASASDVIERLRAVTPDGQTLSGGIATWDGSESAESLLARADSALYAAKYAGRDRIVTVGLD